MLEEAKMINVRLKGRDLLIFEQLCREHMRNSSSMLRFLILQEYERRLPAKTAADFANHPIQAERS